MNKDDFKICVIGLGYVGLPAAIALSKHFSVIGFDVDQNRVKDLARNIDKNKEHPKEELANANIHFSYKEDLIKTSNFIIVAVPTPITEANIPNLKYLEDASKLVGSNLKSGSIVIYESTVYPGATEELCVPVIEKYSGLKCGQDWKIGYSPERINPGDKIHTIENIVKITAGMDSESSKKIAFVYGQITKVYEASSIMVAEAAKIIENTQRDLNIALINELSLIFRKMGIDTLEVLEAAETKWNFLSFRPGLVGGHCIGVDPYYLTYKSEQLGYIPHIILAGRKINDSMPYEVINILNFALNKNKKPVNGSKILIMGITFKENVKDFRNSKVKDIITELTGLGADLIIHDPLYNGKVDYDGIKIEITDLKKIDQIDAVIICVAHDEYKQISYERLLTWMNIPVIIDLKGILGEKKFVYRL